MNPARQWRDLLIGDGLVIGVDEVGTGAWAGPVHVAAVCASGAWSPSPQVRDSKRFSSREHRELMLGRHVLADTSVEWHVVADASAQHLDEVGAIVAWCALVSRVVAQCRQIVGDDALVVVDGSAKGERSWRKSLGRHVFLPHADDVVPAVAAASMLAKVERDRAMQLLELQHPGYGFSQHVGYGTMGHVQALIERGLSPVHRRSVRPIRRFEQTGRIA